MFSIARAAEKAEVEYKQLKTWINHGYVLVDETKVGPGHTRYINEAEMKVLMVIGRFIRAGVTISVAALAARGEPAPLRALQTALDQARRLALENEGSGSSGG